MSFYVGSKVGGEKLLHITSGTDSEATMRGAPIPTTVFHTDFKLLVNRTMNYTPQYFYRSANATLYVFMRMDDFIHNGVIFAKRTNGRYFTAIHPQMAYAMSGTNVYMQDTNNQTPVRYTHQTSWLPHNGTLLYGSAFNEGSSLTSSYRWLAFRGVTQTDFLLLSLNVGKLGAVSNLNLSQTDILIDQDNFNVRGIELDKLTYLSHTILNTTDKIVTMKDGRQLQLVNSELGGTPSFELTTSNGVQIKNNGKKIFDSNTNGFLRTKGSTTCYINRTEESKLIATIPLGAMFTAQIVNTGADPDTTYRYFTSSYFGVNTAKAGYMGTIVANGIYWGDEFDPTVYYDDEYLWGVVSGSNIQVYWKTDYSYGWLQKIYFSWFADESS